MKQQINTKESLKKKQLKKMTRYDLDSIMAEVYFGDEGEVESIDIKYDEYSDAITLTQKQSENLFEMLSEFFKKPNAELPYHPPGIRGPFNPNAPMPSVSGTKTFNTRNANPDALENLDWDAETGKYVEK